MDQIKTGQFLKTLRNEKGMTQEELARHFNVSSRTVSRWETGSNLPDISLLTEIADFYDVDVREIIDGERKSEMMDKEVREVADKMATYAGHEKTHLMTVVQIAGVVGVVVTLVAVVLQTLTYEPDLRKSGALMLTFLSFVLMSVITLFVTGILQKIGKRKKLVKVVKIVTIVLIALVTNYVIVSMSVVSLAALSFFAAPKKVIKDPAEYNNYFHNESLKGTEYSYGNLPIFDVMPENISGLDVEEFQIFYYNPWDPQYITYMTIDYKDAYDKEMARLAAIGVEEYAGNYSVTGEPVGYDLLAMDADEHDGFVYAMIPKDREGNTKITYVGIVFCDYFLDVNVHDYMPDKYLLPGFDASINNPHKKKMEKETYAQTGQPE